MAELKDISLTDILQIKDLWEKNRLYHEEHSEFFKEAYRNLVFEDRMAAFQGHDPEQLKITVAHQEGRCVGYCLSIVEGGKGELASLHVEASQRGSGIGGLLAQRHIAWMAEKGCSTIGVMVSPENSNAISFYAKLGLFPNALYMQNRA